MPEPTHPESSGQEATTAAGAPISNPSRVRKADCITANLQMRTVVLHVDELPPNLSLGGLGWIAALANCGVG